MQVSAQLGFPIAYFEIRVHPNRLHDPRVGSPVLLDGLVHTIHAQSHAMSQIVTQTVRLHHIELSSAHHQDLRLHRMDVLTCLGGLHQNQTRLLLKYRERVELGHPLPIQSM